MVVPESLQADILRVSVHAKKLVRLALHKKLAASSRVDEQVNRYGLSSSVAGFKCSNAQSRYKF